MHILLALIILAAPFLLLWGLWELFKYNLKMTIDAVRRCCEEIHDRPVHIEKEDNKTNTKNQKHCGKKH